MLPKGNILTKIALIYGTRPEAIKLGPVAAELRAAGADVRVICTGQHTDLLQGTPAETDLINGASLEIASDDNITRYQRRCIPEVERQLRKDLPDLVVVQGDTISALSGAKAAASLDLALAHVEAGVRSHAMEPWPEEEIRVEIDSMAEILLAATDQARQNLVAEGVPYGDITVTGNTGISALSRYTNVAPVDVPDSRILVTLHRRELRLRGRARAVIDELFHNALQYPHLEFLWPMHPAMSGYIGSKPPRNFQIQGPLSYKQMVEVLAAAKGVLTDSGGLVEEAATLGVPCGILRNVNDRPEAVTAGVAQVFAPTPSGVRGALQALAVGEIPRKPTNCFGWPDAAENVAKALI